MKYFPFSLILACFVSGCTHNINIVPNTLSINPTRNAEKIQGTAGYYITSSMRSEEVIVPSGGGNKLIYTPYRDIEEGFINVLENVFSETKSLDPDIAPDINNISVDYVISLKIKTDSSKTDAVPWSPAAWFGVSLATEIYSTKTKEIISISEKGEGVSSFREVGRDQGVSGQKASLKALKNLQIAFLDSQELRDLSSRRSEEIAATKTEENEQRLDSKKTSTATERLEVIKELYENELISSEEYEAKKAEIINTL